MLFIHSFTYVVIIPQRYSKYRTMMVPIKFKILTQSEDRKLLNNEVEKSCKVHLLLTLLYVRH